MPYLLKSKIDSLEQFCAQSSSYTFKQEKSTRSPYTIKSGKTSIKLSVHSDFPNHYTLKDDAWDMLEDFDEYCVDKAKQEG